MKLIAAFLLLAFFGEPHQYPLRLRIVHIDEDHNLRWGWYTGHSRANLREEDGMLHGIDFEFEQCGQGYKASVGGLSYMARIKKPNRLEVAAQEIGSDKITTCEFKYTPQTFRYVERNGHIATEPAKVVPLE
jgi:hypothetical protein